MKAQLVKGSTSVILTVFIQDSSSTTGAGLGSLDQTSSIVGGYVRMGGTGVALAVDQNVTTEGAYEAPATAAQVRIGTPANMRTGTYELHFHNDLFATGAEILTVTLGGATDMADIVIEVQLLDPVQLATGTALSQPPKVAPNGFNITWGENEANDEDVTHALDGITHNIEAQNDTTEKIDVYYEFNIGGDGLSTGCILHGQLDKGGGAAKNLDVLAYDWDAASWTQIGTVNSGTVLATTEYSLFSTHVGTGANLGLVRIRFDTGSVAFTTTTKLLVDQLLVEYVIVSRTVGYEGGAVWLDTVGGTAGTEPHVNGTADNPSLTLADALTIAATVGLKIFHVLPGSTVTFAEAHNNEIWTGKSWTLVLAGQDVAGINIEGATISGVTTGTGTTQVVRSCLLGACSFIKGTHFVDCGQFSTVTAIEAGDYFFVHCHSSVAGTGTPIFDFGTAIGSTNLNVRANSGGLQLEAMGDTGTDTASIEGWGQIIEGTCTGGTVVVRGSFTTAGITNLTLVDDARIDVDQINAACDTSLLDINLDHLMKTPVASNPDMTAEVADGTVLSNIMSKTSDTSTFTVATDALEAIADNAGGGGAPTADQNADAVWDELLSGHVGAGSTGLGLNALSALFTNASPMRLVDHLRAIMSKGAADPSSGVGTYAAATDSLEAKRELADLMAGSGFSTGTDSLKAIRDAIDDLIAPAIASSSGTLSGVGFLSECVSLIRKATDEPDTLPKYPDADLVEYIHSAFDQVLASINVETDHPILVRYEIPVVQGTQEYLLPCNVAEIWRIARIDLDTGIPTYEVWPSNPYTFRGDGFTVEGNILRFQHLNRTAETLEVLYVAAGDVSIHTGTATAGAADSITFPASPTDGTLDIRPHAYAGYTVRTLSGTGAGQERIVSAYNSATRVATPRPDWTTAPDGTTVYEVLPQYSRLIKHVVACYASLDVLANEAKSTRRAEIERQLQRKMSALKMMLAKKVHRFGTQGPGVDTYDNTDLWPILP